MDARHWLILIFAAAVSFGAVAASADSIDDEYERRAKALQPSDVAGHLALAKWCRDNERWLLVARRCQHILTINPNHRPAQLLLETARKKLGKEQRGDGSRRGKRSGSGSGAKAGAGPRVLTDEEVQIVRRAELNLDEPERVAVRIDRRAVMAFVKSMRSDPEFDYDQREFFRLPKIEQAQLMLRFGDEKARQAVTITRDPQRVRTFDRQIHPLIHPNCATVECHGGSNAGAFRLLGGRSMRTNAMYANFVILQQYEVGLERLINRGEPERSLLLTYGLPSSMNEDASLSHPTKIRPMFTGTDDRDYVRVLEWLRSLDMTLPDYGIDPMKPAPAPAPSKP
jgi:hypothetical protein